MAHQHGTERIQGCCALCVSRCGSIAVVEDGRFVALELEPAHPTGKAICAEGRAAPELVYNDQRLLHPLVAGVPRDRCTGLRFVRARRRQLQSSSAAMRWTR